MKDYIVRTIKRKRKDTYTYEYTDTRGRKVSQQKVKQALEGLYIPPAHDNVKINLKKRDKVVASRGGGRRRPCNAWSPRRGLGRPVRTIS